MPTLTFNPNANPETTSVDGRVGLVSASSSWAGLHDSTNGSVAADADTNELVTRIVASAAGNNWDAIHRAFFLFDTSSIPDSATILSATFELYITAKTTTLAAQSLVLVTSTPASNTALVTDDYEQVGTTAQSDTLALASVTTSAYNLLTLNAAGLASISKTGVTKFGLRLEADRANAEPTWASSAQADISADFADGTNDPKLNVTYSQPMGSPLFFT